MRAAEEARVLGDDRIGGEHLLLAIALEEQGPAAESLRALGVTYEAVRDRVGEEQAGTRGPRPERAVPFAAETKHAFELSFRESMQLGHDFIGTEHLLLGLVRQGDGPAFVLLGELTGDPSLVRDEIRSRMEQPAGGTVLREMVRPVTMGGAPRREAAEAEAPEPDETEPRALYSDVSGDMTDEAREALVMARQSAARKFRRQIRPEDLLWALLYQASPGVVEIVRSLLLDLGADPEHVRAWTERGREAGDEPGETTR